eukprot:c2235_g1_i1.p1 GENE.c2235_g1_i1~~c2235_g1_i1.p1  ORF type:complete len:130 (-),score=21.49 c2235_g1_i1:35-424(-)
MAPMYYRGAHAALLVFDITSEKSFAQLKSFVQDLQQNLPEPPIYAIACNKSDLVSQRAVSQERVMEFANSIGASVHDTSAKSNQGIDEIFTEISRQLIAQKTSGAPKRKQGAQVAVASNTSQNSGGCSC